MLRPLAWALVLLASLATSTSAFATTPAPTTPGRPDPPPPIGTPWPAPPGATLVVGPVRVVNDDGSFIPPDQREYRATARWQELPRFAGTYEFQWGKTNRDRSLPTTWEPATLVGSEESVGGQFEQTRSVSFAELAFDICFRVRTVNYGPPGNETGPYAGDCRPFGIADGPPVAPGPPSVGTGQDGGPEHWMWTVGAVVFLAAAGFTLVATRSRR